MSITDSSTHSRKDERAVQKNRDKKRPIQNARSVNICYGIALPCPPIFAQCVQARACERREKREK